MKMIVIALLIFFFSALTDTYCQREDDAYRFTHLNTSHGLSNNHINSVFKDSRGFMWFGTISGLNRYDGSTFRVFQNDISDSTSIDDNGINRIFEDHKNRIWVVTFEGLNLYDPVSETFTSRVGKELEMLGVHEPEITDMIEDHDGNIWITGNSNIIYKYLPLSDSTIIIKYLPETRLNVAGGTISSLSVDSGNNIWIVTSSGLIVQIDSFTNSIVYTNDFLYDYFEGKLNSYSLYIDDDNDIWLSIIDDAQGVFFFNSDTQEVLHIHRSSKKGNLNNNIVSGVVQDQNGFIWVGTDHGGINIIDKEDFSVNYVMHDPYYRNSLSQNSITTIYKDDTGIIWLGTYKRGINYFHDEIIKFRTLKNIPSDPSSLGFNDVNCFAEDKLGNIWIGTNGGGLKYYDREDGSFIHYSSDESDPYSISSNIIVSLFIDHAGKLWIGTYHGGLNYFDGERFYHYKTSPDNNRGISSNHVWKIIEDKLNNLWIATLGGGLNVYERERDEFHHYRAGDINSVSSDYVMNLMFDKDENLWIATATGLNYLDKRTGRFIQYDHIKLDPSSLSNNNVNSVLEDGYGNIWIGTRNGLNLFNKETGIFKVFRVNDGLPDNTIHSIQEDADNNLWIGTLGGISRLAVSRDDHGADKFEFTNYDDTDGLQGREFNRGAAYYTSDGILLFGGADGINLFSPENIKLNKRVPEVVLTNIQVFNENIKVNQSVNNRILLDRSITFKEKIVLKHMENMFSIEFAALSFFHPEKNRFRYKLEGFNTDWLDIDDSSPRVTYTNLDPGEYVFRVIASNNDGIFNTEGVSLAIIVLPAFWKSKWAFYLYGLIILGALFTLRYIILERARLNYLFEQEKSEAKRRHELDMLKIRFFTNISHEFKTPLTLIINPLEKIINESENEQHKQQLLLVFRNARRLMTLIGQLLDFRRMEVQEIRMEPAQGDIVNFSREICSSFSDLSENKNIELVFEANREEFVTYFDHDKYEKILFNLLSNAFKFTPGNGSVKLKITVPEITQLNNNGSNGISGSECIEVAVSDTGIGISPGKHERIFERFFQNQTGGNLINHGSGIGLSLVKEYVRIHGGNIRLVSKPGEGSCFTIMLPVISEISSSRIEEDTDEISADGEEISNVQPSLNSKGKSPVLLLVEDNDDFRFYLKDNLKVTYRILEASNGREGWKLALTNIPDLIVSDIKMPVMDGLELVKKIRSDQRTSHIPLILLTARSSDENRVLGFETGADEHIAKPFSFKILETRIRNLITQRELLRNTYQKHFDLNPADIEVKSLDEKLIKKAITIVEQNISNPDFSVEEMSRELGMSRVHLYKKLVSLTGKTPIEFIRILRLKRAAQLLKKSQLSVSEVAYEVGFNNPKYFTRYFKAEFNVLPSQFGITDDKPVN